MIEVLVTMLIISLALLGTSGMQAFAMRMNQGGQFRTQAVFLAADLAERMEANKAGAAPLADSTGIFPAGSYAGDPSTDDCATTQCSFDALAGYDLAQWANAVSTTLPQGSGTVVQTVVGNPSTYTITIKWVDRAVNPKNTNYASFNAAATTGQDAAGLGERFSYVATRTIFNNP